MEFMHTFGKDNRFTKVNETQEEVLESITGFSSQQEEYIKALEKNNDTDCLKYLRPEMSLARFEIIHQCNKLGKDYVEQILQETLSDEEAEVVLYGYVKEINVIKEVKEGESLENLKDLIDLISSTGMSDLSPIFDENMEYIDYKKVKELLAGKN